ncbi:hypothetical protein [Pseudomonas aeruginosa]|uniref:hypothetical protein n=1 Tax=Pseudomonas aeruginosa TaxID=287 RepID=UPI0020A016CB|nr:hypothetical protein [Pseudomonas aeruginosa]
MILESLGEGVPPIEDLAKKLCVSKRTLQRLLQYAGHPYKKFLMKFAEVRQNSTLAIPSAPCRRLLIEWVFVSSAVFIVPAINGLGCLLLGKL